MVHYTISVPVPSNIQLTLEEVLSVPHVFRAESVGTARILIGIRSEILEHSTTQIVGNLTNDATLRSRSSCLGCPCTYPTADQENGLWPQVLLKLPKATQVALGNQSHKARQVSLRDTCLWTWGLGSFESDLGG